MNKKLRLSVYNLTRRPGRTIALMLLSLFLSFSILAGVLVISGLDTGLKSLEQRLGADIMVVPYEAATKSSLDSIILQGNPGYFYMENDLAEKVLSTDGIGEASAQFYLASSTSSCCDYKVQIIGFEPDSDFAITPWIDNSGADAQDLGYMDVYVGCDLNAFVGDEITFYGSDVNVAARLNRTGTYLDTAVYGTPETMKTLITAAKEKQIYDFGDVNPDDVVSTILINVADGYTVEDVLNDINVHIRGVKAVRTQNMISDVSTKLIGVSDAFTVLIGVVWILMLIIMMIVFTMIANERKKEFAIYRMIGASKPKLFGIIFKESMIISMLGGVIGILLAVIISSLFTGLIESSLGLPYLMPSIGGLFAIIILSLIATILAASISAALAAVRISRVDAALILRGDR